MIMSPAEAAALTAAQQPQPRRAECADAPLELSLLLLLTSPRRLNQSQHDDRESAAEPRASRRS